MDQLKLDFEFQFEELYSTEGLRKLDKVFLAYLKIADAESYNFLVHSRENPKLEHKEYSRLIIEIAPYIEIFIAKFFQVTSQLQTLSEATKNFEEIAKCKRLFVQRQAIRKYADHDWSKFDFDYKLVKLEKYLGQKFSEYIFAKTINKWSDDKVKYIQELDMAAEFAAWATISEQGKRFFKHSLLFHTPKKRDHLNLVKHTIIDDKQYQTISARTEDRKTRDGFSLTDKGASLEYALDNAHYCIYCHNQDKDSCSKGFKNKAEDKTKFKENEFGDQLTGCPLEEKISEMNYLKANGFSIGALIAATIDNPLLAATGHRICNDCMKSCIYQKQEPVNIPQIESRVLRDVLELDWGFEIYSLITRWNPLNLVRPYPKNYSNKNVLVVGLGPAGFNLSHHLLNDGHNIFAIDGLKIEPLDNRISGIDLYGNRAEFEPIKNIQKFFDDLDTRIPQGFGGVAEYGITVRWNKNNLKIIRLLLERRKNFRMYGGIRFGSQLDYAKIIELGFDHLALATGAGRPNLIDIPNIMAKGVRMASDFLMGIQLTGAARKKSFANMQIRLPILVIGGGLTAIDTATESMAYYVRQVEKFAERHSTLVQNYGEDKIFGKMNIQDIKIALEFLDHAKIFAEERVKAVEENRAVNFSKIIHELGGVNVVYRKKFIDAPCYRLNPEEVELALEEGIGFIEHAVPTEVEIDKNKFVSGLVVTIAEERKIFPAKTIFLAAGTSPNIIPAREDNDHFFLDGKYFRAIDNEQNIVSPERSSKPTNNYPLTYIDDSNFGISFFGDLHPSYAGNVVKAMASAKNGYPQISELVSKRNHLNQNDQLFQKLNLLLLASIVDVKELAPKIIEVIIHAPLAVEKFQPGQFYRLQNYETYSYMDKYGAKLAMEGLAMTGAWVDKARGLIAIIALEMGGSSDLCRYLKKGEPVILMGPTGSPTEIIPDTKVILIGGGLGNAVLFSIGKAFREKGSKVLYFAGYKKLADVYKQQDIEEAADQVIWCCDEGIIKSNRKNDNNFHGNIVEAIEAYANNKIPNLHFGLREASRIIAIGSDGMMNAVNQARIGKLHKYFARDYQAIASINSPMQCMMKEICAQCLQRHIDPQTGLEVYVYSCSNQDQDMNKVDFLHLKDRLTQNLLLEKQTADWVDLSLKGLNLR